MENIIQNSFQKGMVRDALRSIQPNDAYFTALNAVLGNSDHSNILTNEESNELKASFSKIHGHTYVESRNLSLVLTAEGGGTISIFYHSTGEKKTVMSASEAGCDWGIGQCCEWVPIEYKFMNHCNELYVYFSSCCTYHVVNIDEMLSPARRAAVFATEDCDYFDVFRCICGPHVSAIAMMGGDYSGNLQGGAYQFVCQLEDNDGNKTNWFDVSQPAYLGTKNNIAGENNSGAISLRIDHLDSRYNRVNIGVIKHVGSVVTAEILESRTYSNAGLEYVYYGQKGELVDVRLFTVKSKAFLRGQDLFQHNGRLFLYGIKNERNLNYQNRANNIQIEWVERQVSAEQMKKYHYPSLLRGEVYAFAIVFKFCDGTYSPAFHIPGGGGGSGVGQSSEYIQAEGDEPTTATIRNGQFQSEAVRTSDFRSDGASTRTILACRYGKGDGPVDITFTGTSTQLTLTKVGDDDDLFQCILNCLSTTGVTKIQITNTGSFISTFTVDSLVSSNSNELVFNGSINRELSGDAKTIHVYHSYVEADKTAPSSGGGGGGGGGGASDPSNSPMTGASFKSPDYDPMERKRPETPDEKLEKEIKKDEEAISTLEARQQKAHRLIDHATAAQCCNCKSTTQEFAPEMFNCGDDSCAAAAPFVCCPSGPQCPDADPLVEATNEDMVDVSNTLQNQQEYLADTGIDYDEPHATDLPPEGNGDVEHPYRLNRFTHIRDSAINIIKDPVRKREKRRYNRQYLDYSDAGGSGPLGGASYPKDYKKSGADSTDGGIIEKTVCGLGNPRSDNWTDACGNNMTEQEPSVLGSGSPGVYTSTVLYPDIRDCDGNRMYPQGPIRHHRMPTSDQSPHFMSRQNGVVNKHQPTNHEWGDSYVNLLGIRASNIPLPSPEELPKPLCPTSPYKIVYVKRGANNKSVYAKGAVTGTFDGEVYGKQYKYPRYGANSFEHVSRYIAKAGSDSRMGSQNGGEYVNFHSPDTDNEEIYLPVDTARVELELTGSGWRYGLYAHGKDPIDRWTGRRVDQRGYRGAVNLNHFSGAGGELPIDGITYAPGHTVVSGTSPGMTPLMNMSCESSVYMKVPGLSMPHDKSFVGDTLSHEAPIIEATGKYVALVRNIGDQYGSVEGLQYSDLGLHARQAHGVGLGTIEGIVGDVFIGLYSKRRTGYVSNKVGNKFGVRQKEGSPCRWRTVADLPDDKIFEVNGIDYYQTKLPKHWDEYDAKNYAGLHTIGGYCEHRPRDWDEAAAAGVSESDWYFPRVQKTLMHFWVESEVNPWLRGTGPEFDQIPQGEVFYPKLKNLHLDSDSEVGHPWKECFLNRFYEEVEQPSRLQVWKKGLWRTMMNVALPAAEALTLLNVEGVTDGTAWYFIFPYLASQWLLLNKVLYTDERLNDILGIPTLKIDDEGGDLEENITNWEDNYVDFNRDYSRVNDIMPHYAFPHTYNTCDCDDCDKSRTTNEIFYSGKQMITSEIDSYVNFKVNNFLEIPSDAGKLRKLFVQSNGFFAHTTDGIWSLQYGNQRPDQSGAFALLGAGDLFSDPQQLLQGVNEGYVGLTDPNAIINTPYGYYFIDRKASRVYRFFGGKLEEISAFGMNNFFQEKLGFCGTSECYDEKMVGTTFYSMGWDYRYNRLLLTKKDIEEGNSFTISYNPLGDDGRGKWISFHSYLPDFYIWDRHKFFSVRGGAIWEHHKPCSYQTFYGKYHPFMVETTAVNKDIKPFKFNCAIIDTEAFKCVGKNEYIKDIDITFTEAAIWNSTQGTGLVPIEIRSNNRGAQNSQIEQAKEEGNTIRFEKVSSVWRFNGVKDWVKADCGSEVPLTTTDYDCQVIEDIADVFDCSVTSRQDYRNRYLEDTHLNLRFIYEDKDNIRLHMKYIDLQIDPVNVYCKS